MSAVYFQNAQWRVTDEGIECESACYLIKPEHIADRLEDQRIVTWHPLMVQKSWVNFDEFCDAFREALRVHSIDIAEADVALSERHALGLFRRPNAA